MPDFRVYPVVLILVGLVVPESQMLYILYVVHTDTTCCTSTASDIQGRSPNLFHFLSWHRAKMLGIQVFPIYQNNRGSSDVCICHRCIYWRLIVNISTRKTPHGTPGSWRHLFCVCFCMVGKCPKFEFHTCIWLTTPFGLHVHCTV